MINGSSRTGYHAGIFLAPSSKSILSSRTELIYSRHGYNYSDSGANGSVNLDYIMAGAVIGHQYHPGSYRSSWAARPPIC